jgi:hypothetical protein
MAHGGLLGLRILVDMIVLANLDVGLKDHYKAKIDASKKLQHANPILGNMPPNNPIIQRA